METLNIRSWGLWRPSSSTQASALVCLVGALSYLAPALEGAMIAHPRTVWPLWPTWALLVPMLLSVPRRIWLLLIPAAIAGSALYDVQAGVPLHSIAWFIPADAIQVLIATLSLRYFFDGMPRLNTVSALARFLLFAAVLAPSTAAFISARGIQSNYWGAWKIAFFSDMLAFLIFTPAVLSWVSEGPSWLRKSLGYHTEMAALFIGLAVSNYLCLAAPTANSSPALLYSLVPFLLWSALRFGWVGTSSSVLVVGLLSVWGAVHGRGPFTGAGQPNNVFSLQLFLIFTAIPFMILAAVIEQRKVTDGALRQSEERFRLATRAGKMFPYEWDIATDVIIRPVEGVQALGLNGGSRTTGQEVLARIHPDDRPRVLAALSLLTPEGCNLQISYRVVRPDRSAIWVEQFSHAYFDERGKLLRMIGMVTDITQRKREEEAVLQREQELLQAQRVAQVGSWQWDPETDAVSWSKELYRISGRDPNLPPPSFREQTHLYTAESWDRLRAAVAEVLRTGAPYQVDLQMIRPDGRTRWIIDRGEVLRDDTGQIASLRGTAQDITERKQAEDALRASEEKFRRVFHDAGVGMVIVAPDGHFLAANQAFCECLGYTEEELLQRTVESVTLPEDWLSLSARLRDALQRGTGFRGVEKRCLHKSGRIVITESSASLIKGLSDQPQCFVGEVLDITQRKMAEEALRTVGRQLIEAHEEERTRIARELHDDFNQRIALLSVNLEKVIQTLPSSRSEARRRLEQAHQLIGELGSDIQTLSHQLHSSKLDYLGLVAACAAVCRELSGGGDVKISFHSENIPEVLSKEISICLFRVLQEALQNAIKHSGTQRVEVSLKRISNEIQLSVHDSGTGFDPSSMIHGNGLGLISMQERMRLVHGQLSVESTVQCGTTVRAFAPLSLNARSAEASG